VNVRLVLATKKAAVLIPYQATQMSQKGPFVYVAKPDSTLSFARLGWAAPGRRCGCLEGVGQRGEYRRNRQLTLSPGAKVRVQPNSAGDATNGTAGGATDSARP